MYVTGRHPGAVLGVLVCVALVVAACGQSPADGPAGSGPQGLSEVEQRRFTALTALLPEHDRDEVAEMVRADDCPQGPSYEEPVMLGGLLGHTTGWLALSPEEMVRLRDSAERADEDTSQVVRVGTVLSGQVPERFSVLTSTLARTEEVPAASMWLLGTKASLTSTFVAIYPRGGAALVFECAFELYSLPPVELAAVEGRAPAEVWMGYANGTEADLLARLDAAAQAAEPVPTPWVSLPPRERALDADGIPPGTLERLTPFTVYVEVSQELAAGDLVGCVFAGAGWAGCSDLRLVQDGLPLDLRGRGVNGAAIEVGLFDQAAHLPSPLAVLTAGSLGPAAADANGDIALRTQLSRDENGEFVLTPAD